MHPKGRKAPADDGRTDLSALTSEGARRFLANAIEVDPRSGTLRLRGDAGLLVRPEAIVNIQRQLEVTIGSSSKGVLYLAGERSAGRGIAPLSAFEASKSKAMESIQRLADAAALAGWGRIEIEAFEPAMGHIRLRVRNSPIALVYGPSKKPVCHFFAGWIAGFGRTILDRDVLCEETTCAAQRRGPCEFDLHPLGPV